MPCDLRARTVQQLRDHFWATFREFLSPIAGTIPPNAPRGVLYLAPMLVGCWDYSHFSPLFFWDRCVPRMLCNMCAIHVFRPAQDERGS